MNSGIILDSKDVKEIIAKFLGISIDNVVPTKYSFMITGITEEEIKKKMTN